MNPLNVSVSHKLTLKKKIQLTFNWNWQWNTYYFSTVLKWICRDYDITMLFEPRQWCNS